MVFSVSQHIIGPFDSGAPFSYSVHVSLDGLLTAEMPSKCYREHYGPYLWTAGQRVDPNTKSKFVWKLHTGGGVKNCPMSYEHWHKPTQPDYFGWSESCLNLMPKYDYMWNDAPCSAKLCFVCENRPADDC